jgi:hypothetical protein
VASTILAIVSTKYGGGYLIWDVKPEWVPVFRKVSKINITSPLPINMLLVGSGRRCIIRCCRRIAQNLSLLHLPTLISGKT